MAIIYPDIVTASTTTNYPHKVVYTSSDGSLGVLGWWENVNGHTLHRRLYPTAKGYARKVQGFFGLNILYKSISGRGVSIHERAMADFLQCPQVISVTGTSRKLTIVAVDDAVVLYVYVEAFIGNELFDRGFAAVRGYHPEWTYSLKPVDAPLAAICVRVTAVDIPGNITTADVRFRSSCDTVQAYIATPC